MNGCASAFKQELRKDMDAFLQGHAARCVEGAVQGVQRGQARDKGRRRTSDRMLGAWRGGVQEQ